MIYDASQLKFHLEVDETVFGQYGLRLYSNGVLLDETIITRTDILRHKEKAIDQWVDASVRRLQSFADYLWSVFDDD